MSSLNTLTFTLKQHTPLIHFQPNQEGSTLRATEVKPKLDKYLVEKIGLARKIIVDGKEKMAPKEEYSNWFNNADKLSLDYKLLFFAEGKNQMELAIKGPILKNKKKVYETDGFPMMLTNMGGKEKIEDLKNFSFYNTVIGKIKCFNIHLYSALNRLLSDFFVLHNFGNRQNKGFGSFTRILANTPPPITIIKNAKQNVWYWDYKINQDIETIFSDIAVVYALLKTGINFPDHPLLPVFDKEGNPIIKNGKPLRKPDQTRKGIFQFYQKSFLFKYVMENFQYGNEKKFMKEKFFTPNMRDNDDGAEKKYVRAILGVALFNEFRDIKREGKIDYKGLNVDRYASPLLFKVFENKVCFFIDDPSSTNNILGQVFEFRDEVHNQSENITTPDNFSTTTITDMLNSFQQYFNNLTYTIEDDLFDQYKNNYTNVPKSLRTIIDTINHIEIHSM